MKTIGHHRNPDPEDDAPTPRRIRYAPDPDDRDADADACDAEGRWSAERDTCAERRGK